MYIVLIACKAIGGYPTTLRRSYRFVYTTLSESGGSVGGEAQAFAHMLSLLVLLRLYPKFIALMKSVTVRSATQVYGTLDLRKKPNFTEAWAHCVKFEIFICSSF